MAKISELIKPTDYDQRMTSLERFKMATLNDGTEFGGKQPLIVSQPVQSSDCLFLFLFLCSRDKKEKEKTMRAKKSSNSVKVKKQKFQKRQQRQKRDTPAIQRMRKIVRRSTRVEID